MYMYSSRGILGHGKKIYHGSTEARQAAGGENAGATAAGKLRAAGQFGALGTGQRPADGGRILDWLDRPEATD